METQAAPRRVQFSSCDQCRKARVGCDAHRKGNPGTDTDQTSVRCTRCRNRDEQCTFDWMREHKKTPVTKHRKRPRSSSTSTIHSSDATLHAQPAEGVAHHGRSPFPTVDTPRFDYRPGSTVTSPLNAASTPPDTAELLGPSERQWVRRVYHDSFETIFGSWIGTHGCPFTFGKQGIWGISVSISNLCSQLDAWMNDHPSRTEADIEADRQIDHTLYRTIQAFAIRWLPLAYRSSQDDVSIVETAMALWRRARKDMLRTINQPSYRSVLTLLLFGLTPVPVGISEDEELDGISGQVCIQAAFQQVRDLRARQRSLRFNGSKVSPTLSLKTFKNIDDSVATERWINAENTVFYAALTFDTSATLTWSARSILSAGLFGFDNDASFRLTRTCGKLFRDATQEWHRPDFELTDYKANQIISSGTAWKMLMWKLCSVCKEALVEGYDEFQVSKACLAVTDGVDEWNASYKPLMLECQKRIQYLNQDTKLRWYSLMLHFHLSLLMLVDAVEATEHYEMLRRLADIRSEAENALLNTIIFGLNNTYTLPLTEPSTTESDGDSEVSPKANVTVSLIAIDPYVHHIVAGVEFLRKTISRDFGADKISIETCKSLCGTLQRTLENLPASSKSVQAAKEDLRLNPPCG